MPKHEPEVLAAIKRRNPLSRQVVIDNAFAGVAHGEQVLCCPRCGSRFLHCGGGHDSYGDTYILFSCESCRGAAAEFELVITEHKGNVFIEWREPRG
jgi:hypothetical protein